MKKKVYSVPAMMVYELNICQSLMTGSPVGGNVYGDAIGTNPNLNLAPELRDDIDFLLK